MGLFDISGGIKSEGQAAGDLLAAQGSFASADAYRTASGIAKNNEAITKRSGDIQQQQENQAIITAIGGEQASTAGAGFSTSSGSAGDLMRMSAQKAALSKQLLANQTEITMQGFDQQAAAYTGQAKAADAQGNMYEAEGAANAAGGIFQMFGL